MELTKEERREIWLQARLYVQNAMKVATIERNGVVVSAYGVQDFDFWSDVVRLATNNERELRHKKLLAIRNNHGRKRLSEMNGSEGPAAARLRGGSPDNPLLDT